MEYVYRFVSGEGNIHTPGVASVADIKNETLVSEPNRIVRRSTYPNGFVIVIDQTNDTITMTCNRELIENEDGSFTAPTM